MTKNLVDRFEQWRFRRQFGIGRALWPKILIGVGVLLLSVGLARTAFSLKTRSSLRTEVASLRAEVVDLEDVLSIQVETTRAMGEKLTDGIPEGGVPGPILAEVFAILDSVGIHSFEYRVRERLRTDDTEVGSDDGDPDGWDEEGDAWGDEAWAEDEGEDEGTSDEDSEGLEATPGLSLYHWKVDLTLQTTYEHTIAFLTALATAPRHWRTSETDLRRAGRSLEVVLLLETFTRPSTEAGESEEVVPSAFNNPFQTQRRARSGAVVPQAPTLRAVMSGAAPKAWIGGQILTAGESVAQWTVEEIDDDGVWIRHTSGHRMHLSVEG